MERARQRKNEKERGNGSKEKEWEGKRYTQRWKGAEREYSFRVNRNREKQ